MNPGAMWNHRLHLADEGLVDVNAELGNIDHLIDGVVRPVLDPLDVGLHLTQHGVERTIAEALDKGLHEAGNVRFHSVDRIVVEPIRLVMEPTGNNVGLHRIMNRVARFLMKTLHEVVARFYQGMSGFVVEPLKMRRRFASDTVMRHRVDLL